jgi:pimeloyl-ACP methyl ester carboxylesterase
VKHRLTQRVLTTRDGGRLELFSLGQGPGVVIVHGAMVTIHQYLGIIYRLHRATGLPVHFYHRRGRGSSSEQPANYSMRTEMSDAASILQATESRLLLGHSFGGAVALHTAREVGPDLLDALLTYDAAANVAGSFPTHYLPEARAALDAGHPALATAIAGKNLGTVPLVPRVPQPVLTQIVRTAARTSLGAQLEYLCEVTLNELGQLQVSDRAADEYANDVPTQLLVGSRSPRFFRAASESIAENTNATMALVPGQHHDGGTRGPLIVVKAIDGFLRPYYPDGTRAS